MEEKKNKDIKLYMYDFNQCDTKRCTGRKLAKQNYVKILKLYESFKGIVLVPPSPFFGTDSSNSDNSNNIKSMLNPKLDREIIASDGLCVIDCSWNKIANLLLNNNNAKKNKTKDNNINNKNDLNFLRQLQHLKCKKKNYRILPFILPANPTHFGKKDCHLSCAEAFSTALFITGFIDESVKLLSVFGWGSSFFNINRDFLQRYSSCTNNTDLINEQNNCLAALSSEASERNTSIDLWDQPNPNRIGTHDNLNDNDSDSSSDDSEEKEQNEFVDDEEIDDTKL